MGKKHKNKNAAYKGKKKQYIVLSDINNEVFTVIRAKNMDNKFETRLQKAVDVWQETDEEFLKFVFDRLRKWYDIKPVKYLATRVYC